eukprot:Gb_40225 [translate_table: standard]
MEQRNKQRSKPAVPKGSGMGLGHPVYSISLVIIQFSVIFESMICNNVKHSKQYKYHNVEKSHPTPVMLQISQNTSFARTAIVAEPILVIIPY